MTEEQIAALHQQMGAEMLADPRHWREMAQDLRLAADTLMERIEVAIQANLPIDVRRISGLEPVDRVTYDAHERQIHTFRVAHMLYAMSFENAFKGLAVKAGGEPITGTDGHDLLLLAKSARVRPNVEENQILGYLTGMIQLGRYGVGFTTKPKGKGKRKLTFGAQLIHRHFYDLPRLWSRLERRFDEP
jgi:hypothetical protein